MKTDPGFLGRLRGAVAKVRSGNKDLLRRFKTPAQAFPVSEGISDAPVSPDLAKPGELVAAKKEKKKGALTFPDLMLMPTYVIGGIEVEKPKIKDRASAESVKKPDRLMDQTMRLKEESVGTVTFDTSKGSTMVS